jgi:hypothetical protein
VEGNKVQVTRLEFEKRLSIPEEMSATIKRRIGIIGKKTLMTRQTV